MSGVNLLGHSDIFRMAGGLKEETSSFCGTSEAVGCFRIKLSMAFPASGCQKLAKVDDGHKCYTFYEKHVAMEVAADALGEEQKGYVVRISGGNNKQGFPTKQSDFTPGCVCLLLSKGHSCQRPGGPGERAHICSRVHWGHQSQCSQPGHCKKSRKGIPGLTDTTVPRHLESKRDSRICKFSSLSKEDGAHQYAVRKPLNKDGGKPRTKAPKVQCFVAPRIRQRKHQGIALKKQCTKKNKEEATEDAKFLAKRMKEAEEEYQEQIAETHRLLSLRASTSV